MRRTWKQDGVYAVWEITVTTTPSPDLDEPFDDSWWAEKPFERLGTYFDDWVSLLECQRVLGEQKGEVSKRGIIVW